MICLHCGHCCLTYLIIVVKDPEKGLDAKDNYISLDGTKRCPHLEGNEIGQYSCKIHHYEWFPETPCGQHSQIEFRNSNCRLGEHFLK